MDPVEAEGGMKTMIQHHSSYHVEKMMQFRQAEMNKRARMGLLRNVMAEQTADRHEDEAHARQNVWHKWFGKKRLTTSWK